jgi:NAD(P)-dependent dehydrogenase (short-subunit alcohol dehydrogenase family)
MSGDFLGLAGKTVVVLGVANRKSVAWHVGRVLHEADAQVVYVVRSEQRKQGLAKLMDGAEVYVCDVEHEDQIDRVRDEIKARHPVVHGLVHSIAFADYSDGLKPFHETGWWPAQRETHPKVGCFQDQSSTSLQGTQPPRNPAVKESGSTSPDPTRPVAWAAHARCSR